MLVERLYQVWYVYDDGREGLMSRPDEPMTHKHALQFRKGCMQGVRGRRLELREVEVSGISAPRVSGDVPSFAIREGNPQRRFPRVSGDVP
jgi:hypothetical protein